MPTYSYRCTDCGEAFDIQQAFTDDTLTVCPNCGGALRKLFNSVGVTFNGSGFYRNDSRPKPKSEGGSSSSESSSSDSSSATSSAPSTPVAPKTSSKKESKSTTTSTKE
ncbi:MAG: FmdB family zinc ribbon protein [Pseudolysinimonas sp.]